MYPLRDLTAGERLFIARRRAGWTMAAAAEEHGVTEWRYREWEKDKVTDTPAPVAYLDKPLTINEACIIARRRKNWSICQLGMLTNLSHVTVIKHEKNPDKDTNPLVPFWTRTGWPKRVGPIAART